MPSMSSCAVHSRCRRIEERTGRRDGPQPAPAQVTAPTAREAPARDRPRRHRPRRRRPHARQPRGHVREPDRRPRRGRHRPRRPQGRAEPARPRRRAGGARRPRRAGHRPPPLDDGAAGAAGAAARACVLEVFYDDADRAEHLGARRRLLRAPARTPRARTSRRSPPCSRVAGSPATCRCRSHRTVRVEFVNASDARDDPLLPARLHARARARRRPRPPARDVPPREPDHAAARLRDRRRACAARAASSAATSACACIDAGRLVRRGRGEGVPRRRHRPPHDLRHRARGLRRQRVGPRAVPLGATPARRWWCTRARARAAVRSPATPTSSASTAGTSPTRSCSPTTCA